jgi:hypothetical protein
MVQVLVSSEISGLATIAVAARDSIEVRSQVSNDHYLLSQFVVLHPRQVREGPSSRSMGKTLGSICREYLRQHPLVRDVVQPKPLFSIQGVVLCYSV